MDIQELQHIYASHPNTLGLAKQMENSSVRTIFLGGLHASASPLFFSSYLKTLSHSVVFVLGDAEEAGYFYHDLVQINGDANVLFFRPRTAVPSSTGRRMQGMKSSVRRC